MSEQNNPEHKQQGAGDPCYNVDADRRGEADRHTANSIHSRVAFRDRILADPDETAPGDAVSNVSVYNQQSENRSPENRSFSPLGAPVSENEGVTAGKASEQEIPDSDEIAELEAVDENPRAEATRRADSPQTNQVTQTNITLQKQLALDPGPGDRDVATASTSKVADLMTTVESEENNNNVSTPQEIVDFDLEPRLQQHQSANDKDAIATRVELRDLTSNLDDIPVLETRDYARSDVKLPEPQNDLNEATNSRLDDTEKQNVTHEDDEASDHDSFQHISRLDDTDDRNVNCQDNQNFDHESLRVSVSDETSSGGGRSDESDDEYSEDESEEDLGMQVVDATAVQTVEHTMPPINPLREFSMLDICHHFYNRQCRSIIIPRVRAIYRETLEAPSEEALFQITPDDIARHLYYRTRRSTVIPRAQNTYQQLLEVRPRHTANQGHMLPTRSLSAGPHRTDPDYPPRNGIDAEKRDASPPDDCNVNHFPNPDEEASPNSSNIDEYQNIGNQVFNYLEEWLRMLPAEADVLPLEPDDDVLPPEPDDDVLPPEPDDEVPSPEHEDDVLPPELPAEPEDDVLPPEPEDDVLPPEVGNPAVSNGAREYCVRCGEDIGNNHRCLYFQDNARAFVDNAVQEIPANVRTFNDNPNV